MMDMVDTISKPEHCPYQNTDYDGYPGCKYNGVDCDDDNKFPMKCPLREGNITVKKRKNKKAKKTKKEETLYE